MGWENYHLHQFIKDGTFYTIKMKDDFLWDEMKNVDYKKHKVSDLLKSEKDTIIYEYDFGDSWEHEITLEKIIPDDPSDPLPMCIGGKMNGPPEDCGGVWGYSDLLKILSDPKNEQRDGLLEWLGGDFNPEHFDLTAVNRRLKKKNFGCH
jgi:hypothetical protein